MLRLRQLGSLATRVDVLKQGSPVGSLLFRHDFATEREGRGKGEDDADFELLPPGCSMVDPTYALNEYVWWRSLSMRYEGLSVRVRDSRVFVVLL